MEYMKGNEAVVEVDDDGGWVDTHHNLEVNAPDDEPASEMKEVKAEEQVEYFAAIWKTLHEHDTHLFDELYGC